MVSERRLYVGFEFSRLDAARSGSALTAIQGCHSLPSPFESPVPKGKERFQRSFPFGLPWGIRTPNRQNRNLILYPIELQAHHLILYRKESEISMTNSIPFYLFDIYILQYIVMF